MSLLQVAGQQITHFFGTDDFPKILFDKGLLALVLAGFGYFISRALERYKSILSAQNDKAKQEREAAAQLSREERQRREDADRESRERKEEAERDERQRTLVPRTQLEIACRFFGPEGKHTIADVRLIAENKGRTIRILEKIVIRIFTMIEGEEPSLYLSKDGSHRLALRGPTVKETIEYGFSLEPGITQAFPFTTLLDAKAKYVLIKIDVETEKDGTPGSTWLGEARFFRVDPELAAPARAAGL